MDWLTSRVTTYEKPNLWQMLFGTVHIPTIQLNTIPIDGVANILTNMQERGQTTSTDTRDLPIIQIICWVVTQHCFRMAKVALKLRDPLTSAMKNISNGLLLTTTRGKVVFLRFIRC